VGFGFDYAQPAVDLTNPLIERSRNERSWALAYFDYRSVQVSQPAASLITSLIGFITRSLSVAEMNKVEMNATHPFPETCLEQSRKVVEGSFANPLFNSHR